MNVIITGGSRGIGAEAVRRFSALGHRVAFLYEKDAAAARSVSSETGAEPSDAMSLTRPPQPPYSLPWRIPISSSPAQASPVQG